MTGDSYWRIAIDAPLRQYFDYLPCKTPLTDPPRPGVRVRVPFGRRETVGILHSLVTESPVPAHRLRAATEVLDRTPVVDSELLGLLDWAAGYYHHPPGEVFAAALPRLLRGGRQAVATRRVWRLCDCLPADAVASLHRAPSQRAVFDLLSAAPDGLPDSELQPGGPGWRRAVGELQRKALVEAREVPLEALLPAPPRSATGPELYPAQAAAVEHLRSRQDHFGAHLLFGITGSGKTEVYLRVIDESVRSGRQALVLVPEIGLTPQLVNRFRVRIEASIAVLHSGLGDAERLAAWRAAAAGSAGVVIGTRSAVFAPLPNPGIIVVDEEHDSSYKQHEGFRYSARDLAIVRARKMGIPVVLGSATPSLESLKNVALGRYSRLDLPQRPGAARPPRTGLVDLRKEPVNDGLSTRLVLATERHLAAGGQVLLFLNRRGYAPVLFCVQCGWSADCQRCDTRMTLHASRNRLLCHHCGTERVPDPHCPTCKEPLHPVGQGTERIEETLGSLFPATPVVRIDRDTTRSRGAMEARLTDVHAGKSCILVGTQMLTKGHHFPEVSLVGIVNADQGLFGTDFRSNERLAQLIVQVSGRAGRADRPGEVLIQTAFPDHPLLNTLVRQGYDAFAGVALAERDAAGWPPSSHIALLRASATRLTAPFDFLQTARRQLVALTTAVQVFGPAPAPMPRRAGRFRAQLLLQCSDRGDLHRAVRNWLPLLESLPGARRVRWSIDIDPQELY